MGKGREPSSWHDWVTRSAGRESFALFGMKSFDYPPRGPSDELLVTLEALKVEVATSRRPRRVGITSGAAHKGTRATLPSKRLSSESSRCRFEVDCACGDGP